MIIEISSKKCDKLSNSRENPWAVDFFSKCSEKLRRVFFHVRRTDTLHYSSHRYSIEHRKSISGSIWFLTNIPRFHGITRFSKEKLHLFYRSISLSAILYVVYFVISSEVMKHVNNCAYTNKGQPIRTPIYNLHNLFIIKPRSKTRSWTVNKFQPISEPRFIYKILL